jgi:hypothetical protein
MNKDKGSAETRGRTNLYNRFLSLSLLDIDKLMNETHKLLEGSRQIDQGDAHYALRKQGRDEQILANRKDEISSGRWTSSFEHCWYLTRPLVNRGQERRYRAGQNVWRQLSLQGTLNRAPHSGHRSVRRIKDGRH